MSAWPQSTHAHYRSRTRPRGHEPQGAWSQNRPHEVEMSSRSRPPIGARRVTPIDVHPRGRFARMSETSVGTSLYGIDAGLAVFIFAGGGALILIAWQCFQMCSSILNPSDSSAEPGAAEAPAAPVLLPRASSREKIAQKSAASMKLVPEPHRDLEAGSNSAVTFKASTRPKLSQLAKGERPLRTPLMKGSNARVSEGCISP